MYAKIFESRNMTSAIIENKNMLLYEFLCISKFFGGLHKEYAYRYLEKKTLMSARVILVSFIIIKENNNILDRL